VDLHVVRYLEHTPLDAFPVYAFPETRSPEFSVSFRQKCVP